MYNPSLLNLVVDEQNRRIREQHLIAQAYNQAERKPVNPFGWIRSLLPGRSRKQSDRFTPAGEISRQGEAPC
jgi:hypothetical protein